MRLCLLGGSTSVLKNGFSYGLCKEEDINLAIGATSSIQNIHSLIKNRCEIDGLDLIITQSNINDIYNINNACYSKSLVLNNIRHLYDELYRTGKTIVSVLLPIARYLPQIASQKLCDEVNELHRALCQKYGVYLIDADKYFLNLDVEELSTKIMMPDSLHVVESYMYCLGENIRKYFEVNSNLLNKSNELDSNFFLNNHFPNLNKVTKGNSKFKRELFLLSEKVNIEVTGAVLCGIETWSDGYSKVKITDCFDKLIFAIKSFNQNLAFNEISCDKFSNFKLESHIGNTLLVTEPTVNCRREENVENFTLLSSLLFKKTNCSLLELNLNLKLDLNFLLPSKEPYISGVTRMLKNHQYLQALPQIQSESYSKSLSPEVINSIRDSALLLESINLKLALSLMELAHKARPTGYFIRMKMIEYQLSLENKERMEGAS